MVVIAETEREPVVGSCFCGAITYEIDLPTRACVHCHCSMCRRPHGASWTDVRDELPKLGGPTGTEPLQGME